MCIRDRYSSGVFQGTFSEWALDGAELDSLLTLSSRNDKILDNSFVVIEQDDPDSGSRMWTFATVTAVTHRSVARYGLAGNGTRLSLSTGWTKNADSKLDLLRTMTVAAQSEEIALAERPLSYPVYGETLSLEQLVEGLAPGRPLAVSGKRQAIRIRHPRPAPFRGQMCIRDRPFPVPQPVLEALTEVEVTSATGTAGGFQLRFTIQNKSVLQQTFLVAATRTPLMRVILVATINLIPHVLMDGVITNQEITSGEQPGESTLTITGEDLTKVMDLQTFDGLPFPAMPANLRVMTILAKYAVFGVIPLAIPPIGFDVPIPTIRIPSQQGTDLN